MSESWDAEVFRVPDIAWHAEVPPVRYPIPAQYVRDLEVGDELTIGMPGGYFIDGQLLARAEREVVALPGRTDELESLAVAAPYAYWLAKAFPKAGLTMQWWPVIYAWTYRDGVRPGERGSGDAPAALDDEGSWLERVRWSLEEPPVRKPHAARLAGSLSGRALRMQHERGEWSWWMAVSEPLNQGEDIVVRLMRPHDYWLAQIVFASPAREIAAPLYRLFVYG